MVKPLKPPCLGSTVANGPLIGRLRRQGPPRIEPQNWARDADGILTDRRAAIWAVLGGRGVAESEQELADAFLAIRSSALRQGILDLLRQACGAD